MQYSAVIRADTLVSLLFHSLHLCSLLLPHLLLLLRQAQSKREDDERKRQEAAARKAELKRLQEQEEAALSKPKPNPKANRVSGPKVSGHTPENAAYTVPVLAKCVLNCAGAACNDVVARDSQSV
jgi:hypothetical protein